MFFIILALCTSAFAATAKKAAKTAKTAPMKTQEMLDTEVDITFFDVPVSTLAVGLSEAFGLNLAMSPGDLSKQITVNLKQTKLRDVLNRIGILADLSWRIEEGTLVFAPRGKWGDEPQNAYATGTFTLKTRNVADVMDIIKSGTEHLSGDIKLQEDLISNTIIVSAPKNIFPSVIRVIEGIDSPVDQVMIDVIFLEARVENDESGGFAWSWNKLESTIDADSGFFHGSLTRNAIELTTQISSAVSKGKAKVLNSSRILVQSGIEATLNSGEETPVVTAGENGPVTEFKSTGVQLTIKPIVRGNKQIFMELAPTFSEVTGTVKTQMTEAPITSNRSVKTQATLRHGEWFVIGGLMRERVTSSGQGVPLLKDIPLVGGLFKSSTESKSRTQTIVLIRPLLRGENIPPSVAGSFVPGDDLNNVITETVGEFKKDDLSDRQSDAGDEYSQKKFEELYIQYFKTESGQEPVAPEASSSPEDKTPAGGESIGKAPVLQAPPAPSKKEPSPAPAKPSEPPAPSQQPPESKAPSSGGGTQWASDPGIGITIK